MIQKIYQFLNQNAVLLKFYLYFLYFLALLYFISHWKITKDILGLHLPAFIAVLVAFFLELIGFTVTVSQATIQLHGFAYRIIYHCSGLFLMIIYSSAVIAYPATVKEKTIGLLLGNPILFITNVLRLVMLGIVGYKYPQYFDASHEYLWQGIFIVFVIFLWMVWKEIFVKSEEIIPVSA
ncbi:archaeosortase/exosortase family protein [candidate division CSSED10-310 bacterium]|uniref:Archaeosortase/exosortase family protein n=1 Tax=candidate division CSSED10-310 bacterium TaxID=2855610 RepID=A0ABV6YTM4_UNCC1